MSDYPLPALREALLNAVTGQVAGQVTGQVTGQVAAEITRLLHVVDREMSRQQLQDVLALKSRDNFDKRYLKPALDLGLIEPTIPDKPNSRHQKYRITQAGQAQMLNQKTQNK